jgi:hypothetical protein
MRREHAIGMAGDGVFAEGDLQQAQKRVAVVGRREYGPLRRASGRGVEELACGLNPWCARHRITVETAAWRGKGLWRFGAKPSR